MWMIIIAAIVIAIIFGAIGFVDNGANGFAFCATIGVIAGVLLGLGVNDLVSLSYSYNYDNCTSSTEIYDLLPYVIEGETYFAYMDEDYGFSVTAQYINGEGMLCSVHINSVDGCKFDKTIIPSVAVTTYSPVPSEWILFPQKHTEYQLLMPDKAGIYWNTK